METLHTVDHPFKPSINCPRSVCSRSWLLQLTVFALLLMTAASVRAQYYPPAVIVSGLDSNPVFLSGGGGSYTGGYYFTYWYADEDRCSESVHAESFPPNEWQHVLPTGHRYDVGRSQ